MSFYKSLFFAAAISTLITPSTAGSIFPRQTTGPVIDLGYAKYEGIALTNGVNQYLSMRYAAAPLGDLRFRAPAPPELVSGVQEAKEVRCMIWPTRYYID